MSVNYATGLSPYEHKGKCGMPEKYDSEEAVAEKVSQLTTWVRQCRHLVVITGAGISTSSGIPDFRGPKGVWTLEIKGETPKCSVTFDTAKPSFTHMALVALEKQGILKHVVSQNVDGLHLRSGFPRDRLSELHGNMFVEDCDHCYTQYIRYDALPTMALQPTGHSCTQTKRRGNKCRGKLRDTILDWEDALPEADAVVAEENCKQADLCLCLGTSLQIIPCGNYPLMTKRNGGKIVIVNLQPTKQDKKCDLKIHAFVDQVMLMMCRELQVKVPEWSRPCVVLHSVNLSPYKDRYPNMEVDQLLLLDGIDWDKAMVGPKIFDIAKDTKDTKVVKKEHKDLKSNTDITVKDEGAEDFGRDDKSSKVNAKQCQNVVGDKLQQLCKEENCDATITDCQVSVPIDGHSTKNCNSTNNGKDEESLESTEHLVLNSNIKRPNNLLDGNLDNSITTYETETNRKKFKTDCTFNNEEPDS